jgi:hypothetical protein
MHDFVQGAIALIRRHDPTESEDMIFDNASRARVLAPGCASICDGSDGIYSFAWLHGSNETQAQPRLRGAQVTTDDGTLVTLNTQKNDAV